MEAWSDAQLTYTSRASSLSYVGLLQLTPTRILPVTFTLPNQVKVEYCREGGIVNVAFCYFGGIGSPVKLHLILGHNTRATLLMGWGESHRERCALFSLVTTDTEGRLLGATN